MSGELRLMTDLEEEILFRLTIKESVTSLELVGQISEGMNRSIPLGIFHETMMRLEEEGFVRSVKMRERKNYSITQMGKTALLREWNYYKALYEAREVKSA